MRLAHKHEPPLSLLPAQPGRGKAADGWEIRGASVEYAKGTWNGGSPDVPFVP